MAPMPRGPAHERVHGRQVPLSGLPLCEPFATLPIGDIDQAHGDAVLLILQSTTHPELARRVARGTVFVDLVNGQVRKTPSRGECDRGLAGAARPGQIEKHRPTMTGRARRDHGRAPSLSELTSDRLDPVNPADRVG